MGSKDENARSTLAANLNKLMEHMEVNQTALGKKAGVDPSTVGRIRKQKHAPDIDTLERLCGALGVSIWQILVPKMDPTNPPVLQNVSPEERELYDRIKAAAEIITAKRQ